MDMLALGAVGVVAALFAVMVRATGPGDGLVGWPWQPACFAAVEHPAPAGEYPGRDGGAGQPYRDFSRPAAAHAPDGGAGPGDQAGRRPLPGRRGGSLAAFVEVAGAAAAVLVALPLLKMVLQLVMGLL